MHELNYSLLMATRCRNNVQVCDLRSCVEKEIRWSGMVIKFISSLLNRSKKRRAWSSCMVQLLKILFLNSACMFLMYGQIPSIDQSPKTSLVAQLVGPIDKRKRGRCIFEGRWNFRMPHGLSPETSQAEVSCPPLSLFVHITYVLKFFEY